MNPFLISLLIPAAALAAPVSEAVEPLSFMPSLETDAAEAVSLMQKGLRGLKVKVNTETIKVNTELQPEAIKKAPFVPKSDFSDDDASCSADNLTPGVCALASLGRSSTSASTCTDCHATHSDRLERALISEIDFAMAGNHAELTEERLRRVEDDIWPLFNTLPQEGSGLGLSSARYLLHQYFLRKHRWYVRGLNPAGDARKDQSIEEALRGHVAGQLLELLEKQVGKSGLGLRVLAVFVATLEHLIQGDEHERFKAAWKVHGLQPDAKTDGRTLTSVLEVFVGHYLFTSQESRGGYALTLEVAKKEVYQMQKSYDGWGDIKNLIKDAVAKHAGSITLNNSISAADEILESFNQVSGALCGDLQRHMTDLPEGSTGRVPLSHLRIASGTSFFRERTEYLRELGALDETDAKNPRVLIPNYIHGPSNCDGTTSFYDLCCPNECEMKLERLEHALASNPEGDGARIIADKLGTELTAVQKQQLKEITRSESGHFFLHGKRFAQFLNEVLPGQCPRPRAEDFEGQNDAVPDAHASFQKAALLKTWSMTDEEARMEVARFSNGSAPHSSFRLSTNLRGSKQPQAEDFSGQDWDAFPDAHASFQKAALLKTWSMTDEEARMEVARFSNGSAPHSSFRLSTNLRGSKQPQAEDFSGQDWDAFPDAHASFQKAALLKTWSMTAEEARMEVARFSNSSAPHSSFRLSANLRGGR
eukprot:TRINITY_DN1442_c0_g1_i3.p1 TRINITY_DN1442_c0_g1~~TRINITY_DN1442_c0_g1_i3.p1  ORF type:complete len:706 (-),score=170.07 TRINITY_DN1442_c0_g1_i3:87-2204(-)